MDTAPLGHRIAGHKKRINPEIAQNIGNYHFKVKGVALNQWLAALVLVTSPFQG